MLLKGRGIHCLHDRVTPSPALTLGSISLSTTSRGKARPSKLIYAPLCSLLSSSPCLMELLFSTEVYQYFLSKKLKTGFKKAGRVKNSSNAVSHETKLMG